MSSDAATVLGEAVRGWIKLPRPSRMLCVGVCGSQGSGKSTACARVTADLRRDGIHCVTLSLDDLYLPLSARVELAQRVHPLLRTRGVPGTHDVELGLKILRALRAGESTRVPRFDKARDDRVAESEWGVVQTPVDVILFEGWCVGARAQPAEQLSAPVNALEVNEDPDGRWRRFVNDALETDYQRLFTMMDRLVLLAAPGFEIVTRWRIEQERELRARRGCGPGVMTDEEVARFVAHYERITRHILFEMPMRADRVIRLDEDRRVVA